MYESFFGLTERPFTLRPDPSFLYLSHQHSLALSMLEFGLTGQAGFVVVTGEIGSGKTTLIRHFLRRDGREATIGVISNTHAGFGDILQWVFQALEIETKATQRSARYQAFTNYLAQQYAAGRQVVLIVDEAQNLSVPALEDLRLLSNIDVDRDHALQIILVGQPELMEKLQKAELRQFAQRIAVHYHLSPLNYLESCTYIRHRLAVAGSTDEIFDDWAMAGVYYFADGVPRIMNSICDMSLIYAYSAGARVVDIDTVFSVIRDREKNGIQALARRTSDISRKELIEKAARSFDQSDDHPAYGHGKTGLIPSVVSVVPPTVAVAEPAIPQAKAHSPVDKEAIAVSWSNGQHAAAAIHRQVESGLPPIAAVYLSEDVYYQDGVLGQHKSGAFQWLRRHLHSSRNP
jgi:type II secretory pathway predicted ATPase ExeA